MDELINKLLKRIDELEAENAELRAKLGKTSRNSNKPPSSDGPRKNAPKNSREPSVRQNGGQPGHEGRTRTMTKTPDRIVELKPKTECECGGRITENSDNFTARQVEDIVPVQVITVEYRSHDGVCEKCGKVHKADFPAGVDSPAVLGDNILSIAAYLTNYQLVPLKRTSELFKDLFGVKISQASILRASEEAYALLKGAEDTTKQEVINSSVAHFDETGMRVNGETHWLHSAGTKTATVYEIHKKRGQEAMDKMGVLPFFTGTAVHDHWKSYYKYQCAHGECIAHILRTLKYLYEDLHIDWAFEMICLLGRIKKHVDLCVLMDAEHLEQIDIDLYINMYRKIVESAQAIEDAPTEARRLANRLKDYEDETLLFMLDFSVPFTNNLAERDVRMPKAKMKISGGFRSPEGAKYFARIRGFISTVKKKGMNVMKGLTAALRNCQTLS